MLIISKSAERCIPEREMYANTLGGSGKFCWLGHFCSFALYAVLEQLAAQV